VPRGIFAIRCGPTAGVWVESAMDLETAQNRTWFALQHGDAQVDKQAAAEFQAYGADAFTFEVLEKFDEDVAQLALRDLLKERKRHWAAALNARTLWPV